MGLVLRAPTGRLPDLDALSSGLSDVLCGGRSPVRVIHREPAIWTSTYPSEVVACQIDGSASELHLYCKYAAGLSYESFGHRGGVAYEAEVYRRVHAGVATGVPRFYGAYSDAESGDHWLVLEFLERAVRVTKGAQPASVVKAADWLGRFHAQNESRVLSADFSFLNAYDATYYLGWSARTLEFANELRSTFPWLQQLCERFAECVDILLESRLTVIHGEFYPHNILLNSGQIYPIDWESAAVGPGEIDLVTLTEAWKPAHQRQCETAYQQARWGGTAPAGFARRLAAARLYVCFRWMGEQLEWTLGPDNHEYFDRMYAHGQELGLI